MMILMNEFGLEQDRENEGRHLGSWEPLFGVRPSMFLLNNMIEQHSLGQ